MNRNKTSKHTITRIAKAMYNACTKNGCSNCPFKMRNHISGCPLCSHPFNWSPYIEQVKRTIREATQ